MSNICDSYTSSTSNQTNLYTGYDVCFGQSFTGNGEDLTSVVFKLDKVGSPTGTATFRLWTHTGTYGTSSLGSGSALATSATLDVSTLTTSMTDKTLTFSAPYYTLANGTYYVVTCVYQGGSSSNYVRVRYDDTSPAHAGNATYNPDLGATWYAQNTRDVYFIVYTDPVPSTATGNFFMLF